ncbi:MAG: hypothetical protein KC620_12235 [Myxococcales bacterium]|nr:hypothetical protein [Myxococcales bacterium]
MRSIGAALLPFAVALLIAPPVQAAGLEGQGSVAIEGRAFVPDDDDTTDDIGLALATRLEAGWTPKPFEAALRLFGRVDAFDEERAIFVPEEAYVGFNLSPVKMRVGWQLQNWSATEAFHPADVINSRNFDSRIENPDKLGEPMVSVQVRVLWGSVTAFYMPFRVAPHLPGPSSRLSFAPEGVTPGSPVFAGRDRQIGTDLIAHQFALRLRQTIGDADISLHVVQHQDRAQPTQVFDRQSMQPRPLYHFVTQYGGTYQHVLGDFVLKVEAVHREFMYPDLSTRYVLVQREQIDHSQFAGGLEYGWSYEGGADGVVVLEAQVLRTVNGEDDRDLHPFQRDVLLGYRHVFNDIEGRRLQVGVIFDIEDAPQLLGTASYEQRLSDVWSFNAGLRIVFAPTPEDDAPRGLQRLDGAHELNLTLARYF